MKFLLVAINAKYIHSNLGIYSLKAYAEKELRKKKKAALAASCGLRVQHVDYGDRIVEGRLL